MDWSQDIAFLSCILYIRVSSYWESQKRSVERQINEACKILKQHSVKIEEIFIEIANGANLNRPKLKKAIETVRNSEHKILVAWSIDRLIRNPEYSPYNMVEPSSSNIEALCKMTQDITLVTITHPDFPEKKQRSYATKRGMKATNNPIGRPRKHKPCPPGSMKQRRLQDLPKARQMRLEGMSYGEIAIALNRSKATVYKWRLLF